jgi:hypothetical protein
MRWEWRDPAGCISSFFFFWICRLISFFDYYGDVIRLHTPSGSFRMQEDLSASLLLLGGKWRADLFRAPPHTVTLFSSDDKRRMGKSNHFFFCVCVCVCVCVSIIFLSLHIVIKPWAFDCVQSPVRKKKVKYSGSLILLLFNCWPNWNWFDKIENEIFC